MEVHHGRFPKDCPGIRVEGDEDIIESADEDFAISDSDPSVGPSTADGELVQRDHVLSERMIGPFFLTGRRIESKHIVVTAGDIEGAIDHNGGNFERGFGIQYAPCEKPKPGSGWRH